MNTLQIFVSSPGDVIPERNITKQVIATLKERFAARINIEGFFWEDTPVVATSTFQTQFPRAADSDIFICLMWSRIGTPLPEGAVFEDGTPILRPDGSAYESGTIAEFEDAIQNFETHHSPAILMYFKTTEVMLNPKDDGFQAKSEQYQAVGKFFQKWFQDEQGRYPRGCLEFNSLTDFSEKLERQLCRLIAEKFLPQDSYSRKICSLAWQGCPYPGLEAFQAYQSQVFFGRNQAIDDVYSILQAQSHKQHWAFLMVLGLSGSGKSSLIRAGVLPLFKQLGVPSTIFRFQEALNSLSSCFKQVIEDLSSNLQTTPNAILFIDQFEELFTFDKISEEMRVLFIEQLVEIVFKMAESSKSIWVIGTMRSEFLPRCYEYPKLAVLLEGQKRYLLMPPTPSELRQMIESPARAAGLQFEHPEKHPPLNDVIFDDMVRYTNNLSLIQFTLRSLYERRTEEDELTCQSYVEMGGVEGALSQHAEMVFHRLPLEAQNSFAKLMRTLITVSKVGGLPVLGRRYLNINDMSEDMQILFNAFVQARLIITDNTSTGVAIAQLAHETLIENWQRMREWWENNRRLLLVRMRVSDDAIYWHAEGKPDDLLLPTGQALNEAQELLANWSDAILPETAEYIEASVKKVEFQRLQEIQEIERSVRNTRRMSIAFAILIVFAVVGGGYGYLRERISHIEVKRAHALQQQAEHARDAAEQALIMCEQRNRQTQVEIQQQVEQALNMCERRGQQTQEK